MSARDFSAVPAANGLYDPAYEHDACGVAMVATLRGEPGHDIVEQALVALRNLDHRGATGADPLVGDGAGILFQVPDAFLRAVAPGSSCPSRAGTPWAPRSCPSRRTGAPRLCVASRSWRPRRA